MSGKSEKQKRQFERIEDAINRVSPWYERNAIWAPIAIGVGIVAAVILLLYPSTATAGVLLLVAFACLSFSLGVGIAAFSKKPRSTKVFFWLAGSAVIGALFLPIWTFKYRSLLPVVLKDGKTASNEAVTAIFMETRLVGLPLTISPNTSLRIVSLNKKRITSKNSVNWGFYEVSNDSPANKEWPEKTIIDRAAKSHDLGIFGWRADVTNNGPTTAIDVSIPIKIWFENEKPEVEYRAIVSPLVAGATFTFYLVNDCPQFASAVWPDTAKLQVLGETSRRTVPLRRTFKSPADQIMMFFGAKTRFVGDHPCE